MSNPNPNKAKKSGKHDADDKHDDFLNNLCSDTLYYSALDPGLFDLTLDSDDDDDNDNDNDEDYDKSIYQNYYSPLIRPAIDTSLLSDNYTSLRIEVPLEQTTENDSLIAAYAQIDEFERVGDYMNNPDYAKFADCFHLEKLENSIIKSYVSFL